MVGMVVSAVRMIDISCLGRVEREIHLINFSLTF